MLAFEAKVARKTQLEKTEKKIIVRTKNMILRKQKYINSLFRDRPIKIGIGRYIYLSKYTNCNCRRPP